ncbi:MAG: GNAT family N-acetyltransferase [Candidatus Cloacimonetes bacterium]|nr:GNAT family N-acetyltransferase [Candidatus Cloacimonadota bacterium]
MTSELREIMFKPVTRENWQQLIKLDIKPDQYEFIAPHSGLYVLAYAAMYPGWDNFAIYYQNEMAGFLSSRYSTENNREVCTIQHFFIDAAFQDKGIGKAAAGKVIEKVRRIYPMAVEIQVRINQNNERGEQLLQNLGFSVSGNVSALGNVFLSRKI